MELSAVFCYSLLKDRSEIHMENVNFPHAVQEEEGNMKLEPPRFSGCPGLSDPEDREVFGVSKLGLAEKYLNCKWTFYFTRMLCVLIT